MNYAHSFEISSPTKKDKSVAAKSVGLLDDLKAKASKTAYLKIENKQVELPKSAVKLLIEILNQLADGNALTLIPKHARLTTQEAADLLNVSRPFLIKLLESDKIPFEKVGNRRRVLAEDVTAYKLNEIKKRKSALQELTDLSQELDMDY
ncbi:TPA: helix-turn-helix domain-containing protein [Legionella pneumophila]|nr:helix-turn-helix domain-containing protein [Legionella pneumophila]HCX3250726.1 excisionase family DNA-binding protein [Legionella pneumophila]